MEGTVEPTPGATVRQARKMVGVSPTELAAQVGISTGHLAMFEGGQRAVSDETFSRIAEALDVPVEELTGEEPLRSPADRAYANGHDLGYDEGFGAGYEQARVDLGDVVVVANG